MAVPWIKRLAALGQEVQDIQQEIPSTLYPLSNAEDAGPEVGDDFASELGY